VKTKTRIASLLLVALVTLAAREGNAAPGSSPKKKPPVADTFTITQLDAGANVPGSSGDLVSDNGVAAGNLQGGALFTYAWSAQTGFVVLTLGGTASLVSAITPNGIVSGAADTPNQSEVRGFIWTPASGLVTIGDLGGGYTVPQSLNSHGLVVGDAINAAGHDHAFMWTEAGGMVDLDPASLDDSAGRFVTDDGLIIGQINAATGERVFEWTEQAGLTEIPSLGRDMAPEILNQNRMLTGTIFRDDGSAGTFFWSQATGPEDIGSLGGDEIRPIAMNATGTIVGFGTTGSGDTHAFVWSQPNGLVDLGTLGGDLSWANDVNSSGLVTGYSRTPTGDQHAFVWSATGGMVDLGTLGGSRSEGKFVTDAGAVIGTTGEKGHRTRAFVWTEADGMVEMPSLGRFNAVDAASANRSAFAGIMFEKRNLDVPHAVLWSPNAPAQARGR
jgi:probable HAF family extracellular repeat protein